MKDLSRDVAALFIHDALCVVNQRFSPSAEVKSALSGAMISNALRPHIRHSPEYALRGVCCIKTSAPINMIVYFPKTEEGRQELAQRTAELHADAVNFRLKRLGCPTEQKLKLLDAVIRTAKETLKKPGGAEKGMEG